MIRAVMPDLTTTKDLRSAFDFHRGEGIVEAAPLCSAIFNDNKLEYVVDKKQVPYVILIA